MMSNLMLPVYINSYTYNIINVLAILFITEENRKIEGKYERAVMIS